MGGICLDECKASVCVWQKLTNQWRRMGLEVGVATGEEEFE